MELNAKNCLGPTEAPDLATAMMLQMQWYDDHTALKTTNIVEYEATAEDQLWVERRLDQLEDLMNLTDPPATLVHIRGCCYADY